MTPNNIIDQLKRDEGFRPNVYPDTRGFSTVGYGHNLDANPIPGLMSPISEEYGEIILIADETRTSSKLYRDLPWLTQLNDARQGVYRNMAFNLGAGGVEEFHHSLDDTKAGLFQRAAYDMQNSKWYTEVGDRAKRLVEQMRTGVWQ